MLPNLARLAAIPLLLPAVLLSSGWAEAQRPFVILHTPVGEARAGRDFEINANVPRYREIRELVVKYRTAGTAAYRSTPLARTGGDFFEGKVPGTEVKAPGLEYYLELVGRDGRVVATHASARKPVVVRVLAAVGVVRPRTALEEELAVFAEEEVFSAARQRQRIEESPSAITVITAEDIRNYGATSVAEVLRTVPGMDYMQISGSDPNLAARGFNRELSNRLLTLIDGRSAYVDIFGMTFWEVLPISVWEIDRIEVIRGPGSTLYGANAFGGVVNIYTKTPDQARGMHFYSQGGAHGFNTTLLAGGRANRWASYRFSVTHDQVTSFDRVTVDEKFGVRGNALINFDLPDGARLAVRGGLIRQFFGPTMSLNGPFDIEATLGYAQLNFDYKNLRFQTWYTGIKADLSRHFPLSSDTILRHPAVGDVRFASRFGEFEAKGITDARPDTFDVEATYTVDPVKWFRGTFGLNYRFNQYNIPTLLETQNQQHLFGLFGQLEFRPHPSLGINVGARGDLLFFGTDVCPQAKAFECLYDGTVAKVSPRRLENLAPRAAIVWGVHRDHYLRASAGVAFRNPAFVENMIRFEVAPAGTVPARNNAPRPPIVFAGNETLVPEQLVSYELGYGTNLLGRKLRINVDLFYLEGLSLIHFQSGDLLTALLGLPGARPSTYQNLLDARNYGFEISVRATFSSWARGFINYSWQRVELKDRPALLARIQAGDFGTSVTQISDLTTLDTESPMHKVNFGVNLYHAGTGLFFNLYGHFVGATFRRNPFSALPGRALPLFVVDPRLFGQFAPFGQVTGARSLENIDAYFLLNANFGYRLLGGQLEIGVAGFNLLGAYDTLSGDGFDPITGALQSRRHIEYPRLSMGGQIFGGEAIGARVFAFLRGHFR